MTALAQEAIAVLLDLAQRGEIDPWDVQVIEVIDRYLSKIGLPQNAEATASPAHLPESGQAFLWASMLVLLKANTLERSIEEEEAVEDEDFDFEVVEGAGRALPARLEHHIRRRASAPPPRRRRVTLAELIEQIQQMAAVLETSPPRSRPERSLSIPRVEAARAIAQLAHDENLTEVAQQLDRFLAVQLPQLIPDFASIGLDDLLGWWVQANRPSEESRAKHPNSDRVGVFWALLLLSAQSKVELHQEEFYQDLQIRRIEP
ncbi:segregation/condensation protein A [Oscillatoria sp. FACHB-1406]|uniref:segregation/condensation protein A n=1 Tax=Oscillatoria sp. FACHB-1406 TaxID=2692846 RepID=UPI0016861681|nr:segregation/condensation protein A [Oscillatoria sp. FACHB-1406]MBD2577149.1 segregation/condensation protein A [Oscillatoria sp. FACHB-1406]